MTTSESLSSDPAPLNLTQLATSVDGLGTEFLPLRWTSVDGLRLAARDYGDSNARHLPLICLPGLTRNARDFEPVAAHLVPLGLRVLVIESRGRGRSDRDPNPANYTPLTELNDALRLIDSLGMSAISMLGTSRGGILAMIAALVRPGLIKRAILNDVGPRLELEGLLKIKGYVGRDLGDITWEQAIFSLSVSQGSQFPRLDPAGWERYARRIWADRNGRPVLDYDPAIGHGFAGLTPETKLPETWEAFAALAQNPVLVLRGGLSDLFSAETLREMKDRHSTVEAHEIQDEAHAPLLEDATTLQRMTTFLMA